MPLIQHKILIVIKPNSSIGQICKDLNEIVGQGIYYDRFEIQNTKWLWLQP